MGNVATDKPKIQGNVHEDIARLFHELAANSKSKSAFLEEHLAASLGKIHIELTQEEVSELSEIAESNRRTMEQQAAVIISDYLKNLKKK
ncbi:hypothetical protein C1752_10572 [Acaryochloris thomasi RCC1774]|uniref:Uncharacterized protein n=1 Tax=Acaryochloris thomasi RCC1774 TaxID=1764569 RepID=A0A2W1JFX7_9CYAN|nr:hypothetical protein [Acaryochloris thomasi]PZD70565.1 hypothetical protein C1752_10572 [Acaryochloris thomasi RCC1774]